MTMNVQNQLRLLMLSVLAFFAICTAANAVDPECLPANICGFRYYVIQEDGDLVNWGDYAPASYKDADILAKNVASIVSADLRVTLVIDRDRSLRAIDGSTLYNTSSSDPLLEDVAVARCGLNHYLALKEDGTLYVGGKNESGQLGLGETDTVEHKPTKLLSGVISVEAMDNCSYAVLNDGTLLFWGKVEENPVCVSPVAIGEGFVKLFSGKYVLSMDHTLYQMTWPENSDHFSFIPIMGNVLYASDNLVIQEDNSLWGLNDNIPIVPSNYSQERKNTHTPVKLMENVSYVSAGPYYSIVILKDKSMWLLPNQNLITSDPDHKYKPQKLVDFAPTPQIEIEQIYTQRNPTADFRKNLPTDTATFPNNTKANEINNLSFIGASVALIIVVVTIAYVVFTQFKKSDSSNK